MRGFCRKCQAVQFEAERACDQDRRMSGDKDGRDKDGLPFAAGTANPWVRLEWPEFFT